MLENYFISTERSKLDVEMIFNFFSKDSYWAKGRSLETIERSIENSLCFGVYRENGQVGFGRVVTDYAVFAWILDIFILKEHRKKGLGKMLMESIMNHEKLQNLQKWGLATEDAHGLYEKYGFQLVRDPGMIMELVFKPS